MVHSNCKVLLSCILTLKILAGVLYPGNLSGRESRKRAGDWTGMGAGPAGSALDSSYLASHSAPLQTLQL